MWQIPKYVKVLPQHADDTCSQIRSAPKLDVRAILVLEVLSLEQSFGSLSKSGGIQSTQKCITITSESILRSDQTGKDEEPSAKHRVVITHK